MDEVVTSVKHVTDIISEITAAGNEQISGIEQINQAIMQMDDVTQQNAALVEEAAAAAQSMQEQSENLSRVVSVFKLAEGAAPIRQPINKAVRAVSSSRTNTPTLMASRKASSNKKLEVANAAPQKVSRLTNKTDNWEEF